MRKYIVLIALSIFAYWWFVPKSISVPSDAPGIKSVTYDYYDYVKGETPSPEELPLIIALHGDGDTPQKFFNTMWSDKGSLVRISAARIIILKGPYPMHGFTRGGARWPWQANEISLYGDAISDIAAKLAIQYPTKGKPILVGYSGGAVMAYYLAARHSDMFSTIIPLAGRLPADISVALPSNGQAAVIAAMHGKADTVVAFNDGKNAVERLATGGLPATLEEVSGNHHAFFLESHDRFFNVVQEAINRL